MGQDSPLSVIGYSQDVHYSKLFQSKLWPNATLSAMNLISFAPGCHNDCPHFSTTYDPYGKIVYLIIRYRGAITSAFAISHTETTPITYPTNATAMFFYGNGTAYYLQDNSTIQNNISNIYSIYNWNSSTGSSVLVQSLIGTPYTFYRISLTQDTLYALDRDKALLIIWPYGSNLMTVPSNNNLWINTIESICWSKFDSALYALDRTGSVCQINLSNGRCSSVIPPQWLAVHSSSAESQLVIDNSGTQYYVGYDRTIYAYRLIVADTKHDDCSSTPISIGVNGLQWIGLTQFV
jgi:hypothetical protein